MAHDAGGQRHRRARPRLLRLLLPRRRSRPADVHRCLHRLRRGDARAGARRRPAPALCLLGTHHGLLLPADRRRPREAGQSTRGHAGTDRHHLRWPGDARRHADARPRGRHPPDLRHPRRPTERRLDHRCGDPVARRSNQQVGPLPLPLLAARRHGRPHAGQRLSACRLDGEGRRLSRRPARSCLRRCPRLARHPARARHRHHAARRLACAAAVRHQAAPGLRHREPTRLHAGGARHRQPSGHPGRSRGAARPRPVQGLPVPRGRHRRPPERHP